MTQDVLFDTNEGVATITLNRPQRRNALSNETIRRVAWILGGTGQAKLARVLSFPWATFGSPMPHNPCVGSGLLT